MTRWRRTFRVPFRVSDIDHEVQDELDFHIVELITRLRAEGMSPAEAEREATSRFGDLDRHRHRVRRIARRRFRTHRALDSLRGLGHDVRLATRALLRRRAFAGATVLVLAIGIAAATTVFSFTRAVLLRPLPYAEPDELVRIEETLTKDAPGAPLHRNLTRPDVERLRQRTTRLSAVAAFMSPPIPYADESGARRLPSGLVDRHLFAVFGVLPIVGRGFTEDDMQPGAEPVVILGHRLWVERFGADPEAIGRTLDLNYEPHRIIGVMPAGFDFPHGAMLWRPLRPVTFTDRFHVVQAVGRLAPGATIAGARAELTTLTRGWAAAEPELHEGVTGARVRGWQAQLVADVRPALLVLAGAVALLMLLVCVNVAGLLTSRALEREREVALRRSLGASPGRLFRTVLCESLLLSLTGGCLGFLLSRATLGWVVALSPADLPARDLVAADARVAAFTGGLALLIGVAAGLLPAFRSVGVAAQTALKAGGTGTVSQGGSGARGGALIAIEVGMATLLVVGGSLLLNSFTRMLRVDTGVERDDVLTASITLPGTYEDDASSFEFFERLRRGALALPGVTDAVISLFPPLSGSLPIPGVTPRGVEPAPGDADDPVRILSVSPGYFRMVGIPLAAGRAFRASDDRDAPRVAIVSRTVARRFWGDRDPVGRWLQVAGSVEQISSDEDEPAARHEGEPLEVVGVAEDVRQEGPLVDPPPLIYVPFVQYIGWFGGTLLLSTDGDPATLIPQIRDLVRRLDPRIPLDDVATIAEQISGSVAQPRFFTVLVVSFALLASLVAVVGLYGILAYDVRRRLVELGIRAVLGARPLDNVVLLLRRGAFYLSLGIAGGVLAALPLTGLLESLMYGIEPHDPATITAAGALMLAIGVAASLVPAAHATRADPAVAIRAD